MLTLTYIFCIYSVIGWIVETIYYLIVSGRFQKRGILGGAYCPLYGFSIAVCTAIAVAMPVYASFVVCALVCTVFELITGIVFDKMLNLRMWDYSKNRFNIGGYICPVFSVIWGVAAVFSINVLNPYLLAAERSLQAVFSIAIMVFMLANVISFIKSGIRRIDIEGNI